MKKKETWYICKNLINKLIRSSTNICTWTFTIERCHLSKTCQTTESRSGNISLASLQYHFLKQGFHPRLRFAQDNQQKFLWSTTIYMVQIIPFQACVMCKVTKETASVHLFLDDDNAKDLTTKRLKYFCKKIKCPF